MLIQWSPLVKGPWIRDGHPDQSDFCDRLLKRPVETGSNRSKTGKLEVVPYIMVRIWNRSQFWICLTGQNHDHWKPGPESPGQESKTSLPYRNIQGGAGGLAVGLG